MHSKVAAVEKIRTNFNSLYEVWIFSQIFCLITLLPLLMKCLSLSSLLKMITPKYSNVKMNEMPDKIVKYTDYILSRNVWIYRTTCLKRSIVLYHFLRRYGINAQLCFGVRYSSISASHEEKELEGHAWLVFKDNIYLEKNVQATMTYKTTYCFPSEHDRKVQTDTSNFKKESE